MLLFSQKTNVFLVMKIWFYSILVRLFLFFFFFLLVLLIIFVPFQSNVCNNQRLKTALTKNICLYLSFDNISEKISTCWKSTDSQFLMHVSTYAALFSVFSWPIFTSIMFETDFIRKFHSNSFETWKKSYRKIRPNRLSYGVQLSTIELMNCNFSFCNLIVFELDLNREKNASNKQQQKRWFVWISYKQNKTKIKQKGNNVIKMAKTTTKRERKKTKKLKC